MDIKELGKEYELMPAVVEAVKMTAEVSGKELEFQLEIGLTFDGSTKVARERMPKHIVRLKENSTFRINHIIVHECGHIMRMMQASPGDRVIPSSNAETTAAAFKDLEQELSLMPAEMRGEMFNIWSTGVINQLVNLPVDVRIEAWIHNRFPSLRDTQARSVAVDVDNCLQGLSEKVRERTPESIFSKSNAMVYAYLRGLSPLTGVNYAEHFKQYPEIKKVGRKLYAYLENEDAGFVQDVETINAWAEILQVDRWFEWIGFEDVPESYYE
jgi:hypothetical protein